MMANVIELESGAPLHDRVDWRECAPRPAASRRALSGQRARACCSVRSMTTGAQRERPASAQEMADTPGCELERGGNEPGEDVIDSVEHWLRVRKTRAWPRSPYQG